ncbi:hypothetical protein [Ktedonobacter sp. SOSP1-52]|uniref:hypothetical protein n=1 Tax=Ktedonobacter sp. SOSP1-52 TaxID=2778366 RepID=UPI001915C3BA|nr:hypothetical protein [Ktedonobacter sp. SOSP1-52]
MARRVTISAELAEMESGTHVFVSVHLVCHFACTLSLDWMSPTGQGKRLLDISSPAAHRLYLEEVVAPEDILRISVHPSPSTLGGDLEHCDTCFFQIQRHAHIYELVCRAIYNDDAHTAFDISIRHLSTVYRPQDLSYGHVPWRPK